MERRKRKLMREDEKNIIENCPRNMASRRQGISKMPAQKISSVC